MIDSAYEEATKLMPWERITKTNHKDVTYYKGLLQEYTRDLLFVMRNDFLEEITGQHIRMKTNSYILQPEDTSDVTLPAVLEQQVELMARNVHEVWAESRISQGWTYGAQRDDKQKTHPCLVPYEALPDEEKDYDRHTAIGTLKLIMKLGFQITNGAEGPASVRQE